MKIKSHTRIETVPTGSLKPNPRSARTHSHKQIGLIAASIERFDWLVPIIADKANMIAAGHGRWLAAQKLKLREVPVIRAIPRSRAWPWSPASSRCLSAMAAPSPRSRPSASTPARRARPCPTTAMIMRSGTRGLKTDLHAELVSCMEIQMNGKRASGSKQRLMLKTLSARAASGDDLKRRNGVGGRALDLRGIGRRKQGRGQAAM